MLLAIVVFAGITSTTLLSQEDATNGIRDLAWNPSGDQYAIASWDGNVYIYDREGILVQTIAAHMTRAAARPPDVNKGFARSVAWNPDGSLLATGGSDHLVKIWQPETGELITELSGNTDAYWLGWSPDGTQFISNSVNRTLLWNPETWELIQRLPWATVTEFQWSNDGELLAVGSAVDWLLILDADTLTEVSFYNFAEEEGMPTIVNSVDWLPDGIRLVTASQDGQIRLWDALSGEVLSVLGEYDRLVFHASVSPDGRYIAFNSVNENYTDETVNSTLYILNIETGEEVAAMSYPGLSLRRVDWNPDGSLIALALNDFYQENGTVELLPVEPLLGEIPAPITGEE